MFSDKNFNQSIWHLTITVAAVTSAIYMPLQLVFQLNDLWLFRIFETIVTLLFLIDLVYYQVSLHRIGDKTLPHHREIPFSHRLFWFSADLLAAFPFALVQAFPYLSILRILKLLRVAQYMHAWRQKVLKYNEYLKLTFFVFWLFIFSHWLACGWLAITAGEYTGDELTQYLSAFHWVIETLTTVGYGETVSTTNIQRIYAIFVMLAGVGVYGYVIGNVASILAKRDPAKSQYFSNLDQLNAFVQYREIPGDLQKRIRDYYAYIWKKRLGFDETTFLTALPQGLRTEVEMHLKLEILDKIPLFEGLDSIFIEEVALNLKPDVYTPGEFIFKAGQKGDKMYFVIRGNLLVLNKNGSVISTLKDGDFFGEIALFTNQVRSADVQAVTYCDLYILEKEVFEYLLERFPDIGAHIREVAMQRQEKDGQAVRS